MTFKPELRQYRLGKDTKKDWMGLKGGNRRIYVNKTFEHTDFLYHSRRYMLFCLLFLLSYFLTHWVMSFP